MIPSTLVIFIDLHHTWPTSDSSFKVGLALEAEIHAVELAAKIAGSMGS